MAMGGYLQLALITQQRPGAHSAVCLVRPVSRQIAIAACWLPQETLCRGGKNCSAGGTLLGTFCIYEAGA